MNFKESLDEKDGGKMAEIGQVTEAYGEFVRVKLQRHDACSHCNACSAGVETEEMVLEAQNICRASEGDLVEISLEESNFLLAVIIMYTIPLVGLLVGIGVGYLVGGFMTMNREVIALIFGFAFLAVTYLVIRSNEKYFHTRKFRPVANEIVTQTEDE